MLRLVCFFMGHSSFFFAQFFNQNFLFLDIGGSCQIESSATITAVI